MWVTVMPLTHVWLRLADVPKLDLLRLLRAPWAVAQRGSVPPANRVAACQTVYQWDTANWEDLQNSAHGPLFAACRRNWCVAGLVADNVWHSQNQGTTCKWRRCPLWHRQWGVSVCQCPLWCRNIAYLHFSKHFWTKEKRAQWVWCFWRSCHEGFGRLKR